MISYSQRATDVQSEPMGFTDDFLQALRTARDSLFDGKNKRLADAADYDPTNLGRLLKGEKTAWLGSLGRLADAAGLVVARGPVPDTYAFIPRALAKPSAGGGSLETTGETEGCFAFRREWLGHKTRTSPERLRVMSVDGDSMSPTFEHGDIVLVDEGAKHDPLIEGKVYVIRKGEEIYIKRFRKGIGKLLFMGDNRDRAEKDVIVNGNDGDDFAVIGKVLWAGKEL